MNLEKEQLTKTKTKTSNYGKNVVTIKNDGKEVSYYLEPWIKEKFDNKIIPDLQKKDKDCIITIDGREGCFFSDTLIKTKEGDIKIEDLCNGKEFFVESLNIKKDKIETNKAICIKSGIKELFEIETIDGRKIKATADHTFFILRKGIVYEIPLSELNEGDELICH